MLIMNGQTFFVDGIINLEIFNYNLTVPYIAEKKNMMGTRPRSGFGFNTPQDYFL